MLYQRWRRVARQFHRVPALREPGTGRAWTFEQLAAEVEAAPKPDGPLAFPQGHSAEFVLTVLRAWRFGQAVCPLEAGHARPTVGQLPPGICLLKTTSATTGAPRFVAFTAEQLAADADNIVATMGLRPDWPNLGVISLAHSYGFSNLVTPLLLHGIPLTVASATLPEALRRAPATGTDWTLPAVPALWGAWHEAGAIPAHVRLAISAGAPLPLSLEQAVFEKSGLKIHNFLGATECGGIAYDATSTPRPDTSLAGAPLRNVHLSQAEDGCLVVRGANVGETYWPQPDTRLVGGTFYTSDLVDLRDNGVFVRGRASDLINVAGRKVSPESIEQALLTHPAVRECLVVGVPGGAEERADVIAAVVGLREPASTDDLKSFLHGRLPAWQVPREWRFVDSLSVNQRGKLSRTEWRRIFTDRQPA